MGYSRSINVVWVAQHTVVKAVKPHQGLTIGRAGLFFQPDIGSRTRL
jgi:hypothetical protein